MNRKTNSRLINILFILSPILTLGYLSLNHFGVIDKIISIDKLREGNSILSNSSGFPNGFLTKEEDPKLFDPMIDLIKSNTTDKNIKELLKLGASPEMIAIVGHTIPIQGVNEEWPKEFKSAYTEYHPIVVFFRGDNSDHKFDKYLKFDSKQLSTRVAYLGQIEQWVNQKKSNTNFWVGGVSLLLISIGCILLRLSLINRANT